MLHELEVKMALEHYLNIAWLMSLRNITSILHCLCLLGIWYGIELDQPFGKNDGSVDGFEYFSCPTNHGVFAPPSRIQRSVVILFLFPYQ